MRRIIIDLRLLGKGGTSGIEEYTLSLVSELLERDEANAFSLFYNGARKVPLPAGWCTGRKIYDGRIPNKILEASNRFLSFPKIERFLSGEAVFSPHFNMVVTKLPHAVTFHDLSFVHHPDFFSFRQSFWHWFQNVRATARSAARIIAVSEFTKGDLVELFHINPEKIKVIYSGINKSFRKLPNKESSLAAFKEKFKLHRPFILYLGTIEPRKNVVSIIRAFDLLKQTAAYKDFELVIAGHLGWLYKETLKTASNSSAKEDIRFLGKILPEERALAYNLASVFVYPSFFEGFGFQPLEAQACGVPVIASNRTSLPEVLGSSAILVDPWKLDQIVDAMRLLIDNKRERERYITAGFENARKFTWEKATKETWKVLQELV